jgi:glycosyltransferase involved in cell wall biosynthesis
LDNPDTLEKQQRPLRILILLNLEWNPRLGAVRVYHELAGQWRAAGHHVEHFSLSEAFPRARGSRAAFATRQILFAYKAKKFVRRNAGRFDVIDALIGSLPMSKKELGFSGLLVARSVGLYRLYDRFEATAPRRWPQRSRGKFLGRVFYRLVHHWLVRASDDAVRHADLINVPNESEAECLRGEVGSELQIMVEPYGLTGERRRELFLAAASASMRLAAKTVSFIGMWAARKGAHDWSNIIARIRERIPEARFRLLGTMVDSSVVGAELKSGAITGLQLVSEYAPEELAQLLSDCAVGVFPSYAEGFGLGVLEQLAAGIPTVSFDVPGPRDVLGATIPELLVPPGDIDALSRAASSLLNLAPAEYEKLSRRCADIAANFDWTIIAGNTIERYRQGLEERRKIVFVQPFSLGFAGGGGARILRALLQQSPIPWHSVCCSPQRPKRWPMETHLPTRPSWGRIERSRFARFPKMTTRFFASRFQRRLTSFCREIQARAIHAIPHSGIDFAHAHAVAHDLSLPFFISVHDDLAYTAAHEMPSSSYQRAMQEAWLDADARFVISDALGQEYVRRYGEREYQVVTDGLATVNLPRVKANSFRIYFMGLFHIGYEANFRAFLQGLRIFEEQHAQLQVNVTCRCAHIRPHVWKDVKPVKILPYADEAQVQEDMKTADFLYMPMVFGREHENFARFSVSTKMVTYIGSGIPILYHGPTNSAAFDLLHRHQAAIFLTSLDAGEIATQLSNLTETDRMRAVENALALARREFMLTDQTQKFWGTICRRLSAR